MKRALLVAAIWLAALPLLAQAPAPAAAPSAAGRRPAVAEPGHRLEDLDRAVRRVRGVPADGAHRARGEGPDRRDEARAGLLRAGGLAGERRGQAPADGPALRASGRPTSRRSPPTSSTASSASTWCRRRVERRVGDELAAVVLWVEGCKHRQGRRPVGVPEADRVGEAGLPAEGLRQPDREHRPQRRATSWWTPSGTWSSSTTRARSRSDKMPFEKEMTRIDRELFARLKALDEAGLMKQRAAVGARGRDGPGHPQAARQDRRPLREARPGEGRGRRLPVLR